MNATCGAQKEGSWVVCSKPPHVTDRHSWETAAEYTARMMPRSDDPLDEYRDAGCGHCAHAAHPGRICNNWAGGLDSCACYQPPQWLRDEYAPDTPPADEDSALAGLPHSGCAEQPPQPPLSKPNPARAWFWRAVLLGLIIGAIVAGCLGAWGPVDALGAETDQCVTKHEAAATRPGETFRHVVRRAAPDAEQWTDIRFLSPTVRDKGRVYLGGTSGVLHDLGGYAVPLFDRLEIAADPLDSTAELVLPFRISRADAAALRARGQLAGIRQTDDPDKWARAVRAGAGYVTTSDPEAFRDFCEGLS